MKKVMKSFMAMALGLSLVLAGCSKDDDNDAGVNFEGNYTVEANVTGPEQVVPNGLLTIPSISLELSKDGANYRAAANLSEFGSLSLLLTSVTEEINQEGFVTYSFVVENQTLTVNVQTIDGPVPTPYPVSGSGVLGMVTLSETVYSINMSLTITGAGISISINGTK
jgi:hypothetical protein